MNTETCPTNIKLWFNGVDAAIIGGNQNAQQSQGPQARVRRNHSSTQNPTTTTWTSRATLLDIYPTSSALPSLLKKRQTIKQRLAAYAQQMEKINAQYIDVTPVQDLSSDNQIMLLKGTLKMLLLSGLNKVNFNTKMMVGKTMLSKVFEVELSKAAVSQISIKKFVSTFRNLLRCKDNRLKNVKKSLKILYAILRQKADQHLVTLTIISDWLFKKYKSNLLEGPKTHERLEAQPLKLSRVSGELLLKRCRQISRIISLDSKLTDVIVGRGINIDRADGRTLWCTKRACSCVFSSKKDLKKMASVAPGVVRWSIRINAVKNGWMAIGLADPRFFDPDVHNAHQQPGFYGWRFDDGFFYHDGHRTRYKSTSLQHPRDGMCIHCEYDRFQGTLAFSQKTHGQWIRQDGYDYYEPPLLKGEIAKFARTAFEAPQIDQLEARDDSRRSGYETMSLSSSTFPARNLKDKLEFDRNMSRSFHGFCSLGQLNYDFEICLKNIPTILELIPCVYLSIGTSVSIMLPTFKSENSKINPVRQKKFHQIPIVHIAAKRSAERQLLKLRDFKDIK